MGNKPQIQIIHAWRSRFAGINFHIFEESKLLSITFEVKLLTFSTYLAF